MNYSADPFVSREVAPVPNIEISSLFNRNFCHSRLSHYTFLSFSTPPSSYFSSLYSRSLSLLFPFIPPPSFFFLLLSLFPPALSLHYPTLLLLSFPLFIPASRYRFLFIPPPLFFHFHLLLYSPCLSILAFSPFPGWGLPTLFLVSVLFFVNSFWEVAFS